MKKSWHILLVLLFACRCIAAANNEPNHPCEPNAVNDPNTLNDPNTPFDPNTLIDPNEPVDPNNPIELLSIKWKSIISILQNKNIEQKVKEEKINEIVSPYFDFPLMAKLALGRRHWPTLSTLQQEKFTLLFAERLKTSYRKKVALYKDEKIIIKPKIQKSKTVYIPTELVSNEGKFDILYKIRRVDKGWKIYDVEIEGVSVLLTYRSQFNDILKNGTIEDLLFRLEKTPDG